MSAAKVAISMNESLLQRLDRLAKPGRSAVAVRRFRKRWPKKSAAWTKALARECAKLDRKSEQAMADEGLATYCRLD